MFSSVHNPISWVRLTPGPQLRVRLWKWRSHGRDSMDFRLKKLKPGHRGLNISICPGPYRRGPMPDDAIYIAEDAFWFLEPAIKKHSAYTAEAHYGVTEVTRTQWLNILADWREFLQLLQIARIPVDLPILRQGPPYARRLFVRDFSRNCAGMAKMIGMLERWLKAELESNDELFIAGI